MKINCRHGFFTFEEERCGELSDFVSLYDLPIVRDGSIFTFEDLAEFPLYSIKGGQLMNLTATATIEGMPWEILKANKFVYDFNKGLLVNLESVTALANLTESGRYYASPGLIMPGALTDEGLRVTDYAAWFSKAPILFRYSEVTSV